MQSLEFRYLSKVTDDEQLGDYFLDGQSRLDLSSDNAAHVFIKATLMAAGCNQK